jgi:hypothetical protein
LARTNLDVHILEDILLATLVFKGHILELNIANDPCCQHLRLLPFLKLLLIL